MEDVHVLLLEASGAILTHMPEQLGASTLEVLRRKHVDVRLNAIVSRYDGRVVQMKDGTQIPAYTLLWAAGVRAAHLLDTLGLEQDRLGRIVVEPTLNVPGRPEVFVIGDAAHRIGEDGKPLPMVAPVAMQQAQAAAKNILAVIEGKPLEYFQYHDPGIMATIGRNQAVAWIGPLKVRGFLAWLMWLGVHIYQLVGYRNRLAVLIDWAWSYLFYERAARLIGPS
jgi:NADH dehydrogenase